MVDAVLSGLLYKQGKRLKRWMSRWFVLAPSSEGFVELAYYASEQDNRPHGTYRIVAAKAGRLEKAVNDKRFGLELTAQDGKVHHLFTATLEEQDRWLKGIQDKLVNSTNPGKIANDVAKAKIGTRIADEDPVGMSAPKEIEVNLDCLEAESEALRLRAQSPPSSLPHTANTGLETPTQQTSIGEKASTMSEQPPKKPLIDDAFRLAVLNMPDPWAVHRRKEVSISIDPQQQTVRETADGVLSLSSDRDIERVLTPSSMTIERWKQVERMRPWPAKWEEGLIGGGGDTPEGSERPLKGILKKNMKRAASPNPRGFQSRRTVTGRSPSAPPSRGNGYLSPHKIRRSKDSGGEGKRAGKEGGRGMGQPRAQTPKPRHISFAKYVMWNGRPLLPEELQQQRAKSAPRLRPSAALSVSPLRSSLDDSFGYNSPDAIKHEATGSMRFDDLGIWNRSLPGATQPHVDGNGYLGDNSSRQFRTSDNSFLERRKGTTPPIRGRPEGSHRASSKTALNGAIAKLAVSSGTMLSPTRPIRTVTREQFLALEQQNDSPEGIGPVVRRPSADRERERFSSRRELTFEKEASQAVRQGSPTRTNKRSSSPSVVRVNLESPRRQREKEREKERLRSKDTQRSSVSDRPSRSSATSLAVSSLGYADLAKLRSKEARPDRTDQRIVNYRNATFVNTRPIASSSAVTSRTTALSDGDSTRRTATAQKKKASTRLKEQRLDDASERAARALTRSNRRDHGLSTEQIAQLFVNPTRKYRGRSSEHVQNRRTSFDSDSGSGSESEDVDVYSQIRTIIRETA